MDPGPWHLIEFYLNIRLFYFCEQRLHVGDEGGDRVLRGPTGSQSGGTSLLLSPGPRPPEGQRRLLARKGAGASGGELSWGRAGGMSLQQGASGIR